MKEYVVAEIWRVEYRFRVQAESEDEARRIVSNLGTMHDEEEHLDIIETIVQEVSNGNTDN